MTALKGMSIQTQKKVEIWNVKKIVDNQDAGKKQIIDVFKMHLKIKNLHMLLRKKE